MSFLTGMKPLPKALILLIPIVAAGFGVNWFLSNTKAGTKAAAVIDSKSVESKIPTFGKSSNADLKVSIVSFHGFAPALVANGGSLTTKPGSVYSKLGANIEFLIQDNVPAAAEVFASGTAQCVWRTSDFWAQEQPNLRNAKGDGRGVMVVDNTQGGDAIITKDPSIRTVEDLAGKTVGMLQFTPSHGFTIDTIENSSLSGKKKASVKYVFVNADEGTAGVRALLESGKVDAVTLWDPDLALAVKNTGAHVVYSTKQASNLIFDIMVCDTKYLATKEGRENVQKFVDGWMEGVNVAKANPTLAVEALMNTQELFKLIGKDQGPQFIKSLFSNVVWTGLEDNVRILGLNGDTNHYERVYKQFDAIYRTAGALANPNSPVINPTDSFDYSFIKAAVAKAGNVQASAAPVFTDAGKAATKVAAVTKPVFINFDSGSAELTQKAKKVIDTEMVPFIENNGSAYIELSGNADSVGSEAVNKPLSLRRAQAVAEYLMKQWEIPGTRLKVVGNGSSKPICQEPGTNDGLSLDECRALNRSTRVGVLSR